MRPIQTGVLLALGAWLSASCGGEEVPERLDAGQPSDAGQSSDAGVAVDAAAADPSEVLFRRDHVLEISITLNPADWAVLREEPEVIGLPKVTCAEQPVETPYHYFEGDLTIDGVSTTRVGVRKKGGFGSISSARPALKIKANEYVRGQRISSLESLTLNNNHQDPSLISQCLGYGLFRQAGLPASRCSFAHVIVNGEDLGVYSHVESINEDFLARHFADDTGRLYESGGDFWRGQTGGFQPKTDKVNPDCSDLDPVVGALEVGDSELLETLDAVVNVDAFMTYWAMEVITDHWDGYANNRNNYFFYHDPTSDQLHFIPWGIDALFAGRTRTTRPSSVFACASIPWRLYDAPETRARYLERLRELLGSVWSESTILTEISRMQTLIEPIADPTGTRGLRAQIEGVRKFVETRSDRLLAELDEGTPEWPFPAGEDSCAINLGEINATFDTRWDTLDNFAAGTGTTNGMIAGVSVTSSTGYSSAGLSEESQGIIRLFTLLDDGTYAVLFVIVQDPADIMPGSMPIDLVNVAAIMAFYDPISDTSYGAGLLLNGSLSLSRASLASGAPIVGSVTGDVFEL